jgi:K+-transporting ATPase ATPase C chain
MNSTLIAVRNELRPLFVATAALLVITSVVYPLAVTGIAQAVFNDDANGSVVTVSGEEIGSSLIGQDFSAPEYFHLRPSAAGAGYDASSSGGSNFGPTSAKLIQGGPDDPSTPDVDESFAGIQQRAQAYREENGLAADTVIPADAVTASASGLDPHISPANARLQVARVAKARGASDEDVRKLVDDHTDGRALGFIGEPRVNVLELNIALDRQFPTSK